MLSAILPGWKKVQEIKVYSIIHFFFCKANRVSLESDRFEIEFFISKGKLFESKYSVDLSSSSAGTHTE